MADAGHESLVQAVEMHLKSIGMLAPEGLAEMTNERLMRLLPNVGQVRSIELLKPENPDGGSLPHRKRRKNKTYRRV